MGKTSQGVLLGIIAVRYLLSAVMCPALSEKTVGWLLKLL